MDAGSTSPTHMESGPGRPVSREEQRLWFNHHLAPESPAYNVPVNWHLTGPADPGRLNRAVEQVAQRHGALFSFYLQEGNRVRRYPAERSLTVRTVDLRRFDADVQETELRTSIRQQACLPFDLATGPLIRATTYVLNENRLVLQCTFHHIAFDGWSLDVFERELLQTYQDVALPLASTRYEDYVSWQAERLASRSERSLKYWLKKLHGSPSLVDLVPDHPRPANFTFRGETARHRLSDDLYRKITRAASRFRTTPYVVLLAGFNALVARESGQRDVVIGSPFAGRNNNDFADTVGLFVNTLPLRTDLSGWPTFDEVVARTQKTALEALEHAEIPLESIVDGLGTSRESSHGPIFQLLFSFHQGESRTGSDPAGNIPQVRRETVPTDSAKFDLTLSVVDTGQSYEVEIEYCTDLYQDATVGRLFRHWTQLLQGILGNPRQPVHDVPLGSADERDLVRSWSRGRPEWTTDAACRIDQLVERSAQAWPKKVAVVCGAERLTYAQLNARANRVAEFLRARGIGAESLVAVCASRSTEMVVALLGVLKAGAAYVPLDPDYPADRLAYMLTDSGACLVLSEPETLDRLPAGDWPVVELTAETFRGLSTADRSSDAVPDNLAYIVYTSGSTGRPKGVAVTHRNVHRLLSSAAVDLSLTPTDVWAGFHSYAFDVSVWEIWGALSSGARLIVVPFWTSRDPQKMYDLVLENGVTVLSQTPSAFTQFETVDAGRPRALPVRYVILAGEAIQRHSLRRWTARHGWDSPALVNMYGITETTVHSSFRRVQPGDLDQANTNIGRSLSDTRIHILDERLRPCPIGVTGEIYVSGPALARGYVGNNALTASRFVPDPVSGHSGARMYRSGDLARIRPDGELDYVGRADAMVKVRGFRIELGEIEAILARCPGVCATAVSVRDTGDIPVIVAFVVPASEQGPPVTAMRGWLSRHLPDYMIPARFEFLPVLPVTVSGKLDRRRLAELGAADPDSARPPLAAPQGRTERDLAAIWEEVLEVESVGRTETFFELGGDSIRSILAVSRARAAGMCFTVQDLFNNPTVSQLARIVGTDRTTAFPAPSEPFDLLDEHDRALLPAGLSDAYPMSELQVGMVYEMERDPERLPYHNVLSLRIQAPVDSPALVAAARRVVDRHPILRTSFSLTDYSVPMQLVHDEATMPVGYRDLRGLSESEQEEVLSSYLETERQTPFDPSVAPLFRIFMHQTGAEQFRLTLTEHHAIFDGWSLHSTLAEMLNAYLARSAGVDPAPQPPPSSLYRDFVKMERAAIAAGDSAHFWMERLVDRPDCRLPRWGSKGAALAGVPTGTRASAEWRYRTDPTQRYAAVETMLSTELCDSLETLARQCGVPLKTVLIAAYLRAVGYISGSHDVLIGVTANGRLEQPDGEDARGLFLNTLPFRLKMPDGAWTDLIQAVFEAESQMLPHRRYPMALLQRKLAGGPLVEANFVYNHFHVMNRVLGSAKLKVLDDKIDSFASLRAEPTNFPLNVGVIRNPASSDLLLGIDYHTDVLREDQMILFRDYLLRAMADMVKNPDRDYLRFPLTATAERELVSAWSTGPAGHPEQSELLVHTVVEQVARSQPEKVAVICGPERLTYAELNVAANRIAWDLRSRGVRPDSLVGVHTSRSTTMVVALLGILKSGAAYLPLDPEYPPERLAFMLRDSKVSLVLAEPETDRRLPAGDWSVIELTTFTADCSAECSNNPPTISQPDNLAYVIYTSGSTGRPKGVSVTHRAVSQLLSWGQEKFSFDHSDTWTLFHSYSFDFAVWETWGALANGGRLIVVPHWVARDPVLFHDLVAREKVTVLNQTPTAFSQLELADGQRGTDLSVRLIIFGGEPIEHAPIRRWVARRGWDATRLVNMYGITETTVHASWHCVDQSDLDGALTNIGSPVGSTSLLVLDPAGIPVPVGTTGELYVGGSRLARGYVRRPALTSARFIAENEPGEVGSRIYRSGDQARFRPDGALEYVGRLDGMINHHGFRIELGEIESAISQHPDVTAAAVTLRQEDSGRSRLVCYFVGAELTTRSPASIRDYLADLLPEYMIPSHFVPLPALPRTVNGKLDRAALPVVEGVALSTGPLPVGRHEKIISSLFADLLGLPEVGREGSFFQLGGDSILSIQLVSRARRAGIAITPRDVHQHRTVAKLATIADATSDSTAYAEDPQSVSGIVPLTPIMHRVLRTGGPFDQFCQSAQLETTAPVTSESIQLALGFLLDRHGMLRARCSRGADDDWVLEVQPAGSVPASACIRRVEVGAVAADELTKLVESHLAAERAGLGLSSGPLVRLVWFDGGTRTRHRILLVIHHFAVDGISWRVLMSEFAEAHDAVVQGREPILPATRTSYRRWAETLDRQAAECEVHDELATWSATLAGDRGGLGCRELKPETDVFGNRGSLVRGLPERLSTALSSDLPRSTGVTTNDILLAGLTLAIVEWRAQNGRGFDRSVLFDLERHGRTGSCDGVDISETVGWFTSVYPARVTLGHEFRPDRTPAAAELADLLKNVSAQLGAIPDGGTGYGLLRYKNPTAAAALSRFAQPQISFNNLGALSARITDRWSVIAGTPTWLRGHADDKMPLTHCLEVAALSIDGSDSHQLTMAFSWPRDVLRDDDVAAIAAGWQRALESLALCRDGAAVEEDVRVISSLVTLDDDELSEIQAEIAADREEHNDRVEG
jgi:amino acid adenylation domain-containing protein/non-ribosomal peptide synthase protein (TIGR01720 family)